MGLWNRKCAIAGCSDTDSTRHRFPLPHKNLERFRMWVEATNSPKLNALSPELIYRSYRICDRHFEIKHKMTNNRISPQSIPTLFCKVMKHQATDHTYARPNDHSHENYIQPNEDHSYATANYHVDHPYSMNEECMVPTANNYSFVNEEYMDLESSPHPSTSQIHNIEEHTPTQQKLGVRTPKSSSKRKRTLATRKSTLSPREQVLIKNATNLRKRLSVEKCRKKKMKIAHKAEEVLDKSLEDLDVHVADFIRLQLRASKVKTAHGRRYSLEDKVLGLILHKQSGKSYKLFSKLFAVPTRKTLMELLNRIPVQAGINETIFRNLKLNVSKLPENDRVCVLMLDEMSIEPHLDINQKSHDFDGFEDEGQKRTKNFADHAQVFLLKSLTKRWKQPVGYTFTTGTNTSLDVVRQLKSVITECQNIGLKIVATVSDQGTTNVGAINYLVKNYPVKENNIRQLKLYKIKENTIVHIYDAPHLLKGIRNNFLTKKMVWKLNGSRIMGDWQDIVSTFEIDNEIGRLRALNKIHKGHVYPTKMRKMKVSPAAQVFSHTMAKIMTLFLKKGVTSNDGKLKLQPCARGTIKILEFFDTLFDSVNGSTLGASAEGKKLKCAVRATTGHLKFWSTAKTYLRNMRFIRTRDGKLVRPPSLIHWEVTLNGLTYLAKTLKDVYKINYYRPRDLNQDPLENFFGQMRQHGGRNINPSAYCFKQYFKTLLINNMVNRHSISSNCEAETSQMMIQGVKNFVTQGVEEEEENFDIQSLENILINEQIFTFIDKAAIGHVSGFIIKKINKNIEACEICKKNFISAFKIDDWHNISQAKEYETPFMDKLKYGTFPFIFGLANIYQRIMQILPENGMDKNIIAKLIIYAKKNVSFNFQETCNHTEELLNQAIVKFINLVCFNWGEGINKNLSGKADSQFDEMHKNAYLYYENKLKKNKKK